MKGLVYTNMGGPETLKIKELSRPIPKDHQLLIRVIASSLNAPDYAPFEHYVRTGKVSTLMRIKEKVKDKKVGKVLGSEASGIVEAVGRSVKGFKIGDEVYGVTIGLCGAWAEYVCMDEETTSLKPCNLSFEECATIPVAGTTALSAIKKANIKKGQNVLVYGASGGVGQYIVQLLKSMGAIVTGVCSTRNIEMLRKMKTDYIIDYKTEDFSKNGKVYDVIIGVNGYNFITKYKKSLNANGIYVAVGGPLQGIQGGVLGPFIGIGTKKNFTFSTYFSEIRNHSLSKLKEIIEAGELTPFIDEVSTLEETPSMIRHIIENHAQGKNVIRMR